MCWFFIWENFDIISTCEKEVDEKHKLREFVLCMRVLTPAFGFLFASASREIFLCSRCYLKKIEFRLLKYIFDSQFSLIILIELTFIIIFEKIISNNIIKIL